MLVTVPISTPLKPCWIYIPSKKIAIEYDGYQWHRNKTKQDIEEKLKEDLIKVGIQENKTYNFATLNIPEEYWNDFMRGYLDGDGSINQSTGSFYISYTIKNIDLANFIKDKSSLYYNFNIKYDKRSDSYTLYISNYENAKKFYENVYHNNYCYCLEYKHDVLKKILGN